MSFGFFRQTLINTWLNYYFYCHHTGAVQDPRNPEPDVPNPQDPVQEEGLLLIAAS